jgi:hypothetical protein
LAPAALVLGVLQAWPAAALPVALLGAAIAVPVAGAVALTHGEGPSTSPRGVAWQPGGPVRALVLRDLLLLWRAERSLLLSGFALAPIVGVMVLAARVNGPFEGGTLATGTRVAMAFAAPLGLSMLAACVRHLGAAWDPPSWPISTPTRAAAMAIVASVAILPSWAAASVGGAPALGLVDHAHLGGFVLAVSLGAAAVVAHRPSKPDQGLFPYWVAACLAASMWRLELAAGLAAFAGVAAARALAKGRLA